MLHYTLDTVASYFGLGLDIALSSSFCGLTNKPGA